VVGRAVELIARAAYAVAVGQALDDGPFYHGTKADLRDGDLLTPG
jgi:rifampin ADP-ribosylating transferase